MNDTTKALEALDRIFNYCEEIDLHIPKEEQTGYDMLVDIEIIREALVNQKTGHWIEKDGYDGDTYYDCSEYGESFCLIEGTPTDNLYNYCPNCGAKMEGK